MPIGFNHNTENINPSEDSVVEIGAIYGSARSVAPSGYLACDGSAVSRTTYSRLFTAISTTYGSGNGSTTFNLPDLRGSVPRGAGTSSGYTQNVTVALGAKDNDTMQGHYHDFYVGATTSAFSHDNFNNQIAKADNAGSRALESMTGGSKDQINNPKSDTVNGTPRTTNETKMKNVGVNFFIKF